MSNTDKTRVWAIEIPDTQYAAWRFVFKCSFEWDGAQSVVVKWEEKSIGSGSFKIEDCGITWLTMFKAFKICAHYAECAAHRWNVEEAGV